MEVAGGTGEPGGLPSMGSPFHTVHGVLKARILKWFATPFSSGPHSVKPLHHDAPILGTTMGIAQSMGGCDSTQSAGGCDGAQSLTKKGYPMSEVRVSGR